MKGLPLAYNRDLQEDKEPLFDAVDTRASGCLAVLTAMLPRAHASTPSACGGAADGFLLATDVADYLVTKGVPFREAHDVVGARRPPVPRREPRAREPRPGANGRSSRKHFGPRPAASGCRTTRRSPAASPAAARRRRTSRAGCEGSERWRGARRWRVGSRAARRPRAARPGLRAEDDAEAAAAASAPKPVAGALARDPERPASSCAGRDRPSTSTAARMEDLGGFVVERNRYNSPFEEIARVPVTDQGRFQKAKRFDYLDTSCCRARPTTTASSPSRPTATSARRPTRPRSPGTRRARRPSPTPAATAVVRDRISPCSNTRPISCAASACRSRASPTEVGTPDLRLQPGGAARRPTGAYDRALAAVPHLVCYAVKANDTLAVIRAFAREGSGFDIVSGGELIRALRAGADPQAHRLRRRRQAARRDGSGARRPAS